VSAGASSLPRSFDGFITAKEWDRIEIDEAPPAPQVVALETDGTEESGLPIGAVEVAENDGRYQVTPRVFYSYAELADYLRELGAAGGVTVVHHKSMLFRHEELPPGLAFEHHRGVPDQQAAYARVREAITTGAVVHNGNAALTEQMLVAATHTPREGTPHLSQNKSDGPIYLARALMVGVLWAMTKQKPRAMVVAA